MTLAIEAVGLVKRFGKTLAVDGVDLAVQPGMVLGPAGAERGREDHRGPDAG
jgi:ABC-type multidrug transport system ATPase subunit